MTMKKSLLTLSLFAVTLVAANAQRAAFKANKTVNRQVPAVLKMSKKAERRTLNVQTAPSATFNVVDAIKAKKAFRAEGVDSVAALYNYPAGTFFEGLSWEWGSYSLAFTHVPALTNIVFPNYSYWDTEKDVTISWLRPENPTDPETGDEMEMDENYGGIMQAFGYAYAPALTVTQGTASETYQDVYTLSNGSIYAGFVLGGTDTLTAGFGNCNPAIGFYSGFVGGIGFNSKQEFNASGKVCTGFAETFDKPLGHTYVTSVSINGWVNAADQSPLPETVLGENDTLIARICTFSDEGLVPYADAICTASDIPVYDAVTNGNATLVYRFVEWDEDFGLVDAPVILPDEDFIVLFPGFDKLSNTFTVPFSPADGWAGNGYAILDDNSISTIGYRSNPNIPQTNLSVGFEAAIPLIQLADESTIVDFPVEGGYGITGYNEEDGDPYNDIDFYTLSSAEQWMIVESPEWVEEILFDEEYLEQGALLWYASAEALPEGVEGRSGQLVFSLYGKEVAVPVKQGKVDLAVEGVKMAQNKQQTAVYNLMGQRMNANAKGLLIKNGKKYLVK